MGSCSGFRVVELGGMVTAPFAGQILGDLGAEVIKIEPPGGEIMRTVPPLFRGVSAAFAQWNRNKKSVTLDLKQKSGREALERIVASADAVIVNYRPSVVKSLGLEYEMLNAKNPGLVYVSLTGFGPDGPYSKQPVYDMIIQGIAGFMPVQGADGPPKQIRSPVVDKIVAYSTVITILAALLHRKVSGEGQKIEMSMIDAFAAFMLPETFYTRSFIEAPPTRAWAKDIFNTIKLKDGFAVGFVMPEHHFKLVCKVFRLEALTSDPRFLDVAQRNLNQPELFKEIEAAVSHMSKADFMELVHKNELPFGPVNTIEEFMVDPQTVHNDIFVRFQDSELGEVQLLNSFARMEKTPVNACVLPPKLGEHTAEILQSVGFTLEDVAIIQGSTASFSQ
jgi:crotonobetainyl-CoA:carnitine CoA-transferase CaiB-like acyl-CoA transferase